MCVSLPMVHQLSLLFLIVGIGLYTHLPQIHGHPEYEFDLDLHYQNISWLICPQGWTKLGIKCIKVYPGKVTFAEAELVCKSTGAHLVDVTGLGLNKVIGQQVEGQGIRDDVWIGFQRTKDGIYKWSSGRHGDKLDGIWLPGQPEVQISNNNYCVSMVIQNDVYQCRWRLEACERKLGFICESEACVVGDYRCGDGQCIAPSWRCDGREDCQDRSDENNCGTVQCGGDLELPNFTFRSPDVGGSYVPWLNCHWKIQARIGYRVKLMFHKFDTEPVYDSVVVYDGAHTDAEVLGTYSGTIPPPVVTSTTSNMLVIFTTDHTVQRSGFTATWQSAPSACDQTAIADDQVRTLSSLGYPDIYHANLDCTWLIYSVDTTDIISLTMVDVDLGADDTLEVKDGSSGEATIMSRYTGSVQSDMLLSTGHSVHLHLRTDMLHTGRGFNVTYQTGCDILVNQGFGKISSPGYTAGHHYTHNLHCTWNLLDPLSRESTLLFHNLFDTEKSFDFLEIYNSTDVTNESLLMNMSGQIDDHYPLSSYTGQFVLHFYTDNRLTRTGWSASFSYDCHDTSPLTPHITRSSTSAPYGSYISYNCDKASYRIQGSQQRYCDMEGVWRTTPPTCILIYCGPPPIITNGSLKKLTSRYYDGEAFYVCEPGHTMHGSNITCSKTGWSKPPICQVNVCPKVKSLAHGRIFSPYDYHIHTRVEFKCDEGFRLVGYHFTECDAIGQWSHSRPECRPENVTYCEEVKVIHGYVNQSGPISVEDSVHVTCHPSYQLNTTVDYDTVTCQVTGVYDRPVPKCIDIDECELLDDPCGSLHTCINIEGSYWCQCAPGYQYVEDTHQCQDVNECNNNNGGCEHVCDNTDGSYTCDCNPGSRLYLGNHSIPHDNRTLIPGKTCYILCPALNISNAELLFYDTTPVPDGSYLYPTSLWKQCPYGSDIDGPWMVTCQQDGSWSHNVTSCVAKQCDILTIIEHGITDYHNNRSVGSFVTFHCDHGYRLHGNPHRYCHMTTTTSGEHDFYWSGGQPTCQAIDCGPPPPLSNGYSNYTSTVYNSVAVYSCDAGFTPVPQEPVRICLADAIWSTQVIICVPETCPNPGIPVHGTMVTGGGAYTQGSMVTYTCRQGYTLSDPFPLLCKIAGTTSRAVAMTTSLPIHHMTMLITLPVHVAIAFVQTCSQDYSVFMQKVLEGIKPQIMSVCNHSDDYEMEIRDGIIVADTTMIRLNKTISVIPVQGNLATPVDDSCLHGVRSKMIDQPLKITFPQTMACPEVNVDQDNIVLEQPVISCVLGEPVQQDGITSCRLVTQAPLTTGQPFISTSEIPTTTDSLVDLTTTTNKPEHLEDEYIDFLNKIKNHQKKANLRKYRHVLAVSSSSRQTETSDLSGSNVEMETDIIATSLSKAVEALNESKTFNYVQTQIRTTRSLGVSLTPRTDQQEVERTVPVEASQSITSSVSWSDYQIKLSDNIIAEPIYTDDLDTDTLKTSMSTMDSKLLKKTMISLDEHKIYLEKTSSSSKHLMTKRADVQVKSSFVPTLQSSFAERQSLKSTPSGHSREVSHSSQEMSISSNGLHSSNTMLISSVELLPNVTSTILLTTPFESFYKPSSALESSLGNESTIRNINPSANDLIQNISTPIEPTVSSIYVLKEIADSSYSSITDIAELSELSIETSNTFKDSKLFKNNISTLESPVTDKTLVRLSLTKPKTRNFDSFIIDPSKSVKHIIETSVEDLERQSDLKSVKLTSSFFINEEQTPKEEIVLRSDKGNIVTSSELSKIVGNESIAFEKNSSEVYSYISSTRITTTRSLQSIDKKMFLIPNLTMMTPVLRITPSSINEKPYKSQAADTITYFSATVTSSQNMLSAEIVPKATMVHLSDKYFDSNTFTTETKEEATQTAISSEETNNNVTTKPISKETIKFREEISLISNSSGIPEVEHISMSKEEYILNMLVANSTFKSEGTAPTESVNDSINTVSRVSELPSTLDYQADQQSSIWPTHVYDSVKFTRMVLSTEFETKLRTVIEKEKLKSSQTVDVYENPPDQLTSGTTILIEKQYQTSELVSVSSLPSLATSVSDLVIETESNIVIKEAREETDDISDVSPRKVESEITTTMPLDEVLKFKTVINDKPIVIVTVSNLMPSTNQLRNTLELGSLTASHIKRDLFMFSDATVSLTRLLPTPVSSHTLDLTPVFPSSSMTLAGTITKLSINQLHKPVLKTNLTKFIPALNQQYERSFLPNLPLNLVTETLRVGNKINQKLTTVKRLVSSKVRKPTSGLSFVDFSITHNVYLFSSSIANDDKLTKHTISFESTPPLILSEPSRISCLSSSCTNTNIASSVSSLTVSKNAPAVSTTTIISSATIEAVTVETVTVATVVKPVCRCDHGDRIFLPHSFPFHPGPVYVILLNISLSMDTVTMEMECSRELRDHTRTAIQEIVNEMDLPSMCPHSPFITLTNTSGTMRIGNYKIFVKVPFFLHDDTVDYKHVKTCGQVILEIFNNAAISAVDGIVSGMSSTCPTLTFESESFSVPNTAQLCHQGYHLHEPSGECVYCGDCSEFTTTTTLPTTVSTSTSSISPTITSTLPSSTVTLPLSTTSASTTTASTTTVTSPTPSSASTVPSTTLSSVAMTSVSSTTAKPTSTVKMTSATSETTSTSKTTTSSTSTTSPSHTTTSSTQSENTPSTTSPNPTTTVVSTTTVTFQPECDTRPTNENFTEYQLDETSTQMHLWFGDSLVDVSMDDTCIGAYTVLLKGILERRIAEMNQQSVVKKKCGVNDVVLHFIELTFFPEPQKNQVRMEFVVSISARPGMNASQDQLSNCASALFNYSDLTWAICLIEKPLVQTQNQVCQALDFEKVQFKSFYFDVISTTTTKVTMTKTTPLTTRVTEAATTQSTSPTTLITTTPIATTSTTKKSTTTTPDTTTAITTTTHAPETTTTPMTITTSKVTTTTPEITTTTSPATTTTTTMSTTTPETTITTTPETTTTTNRTTTTAEPTTITTLTTTPKATTMPSPETTTTPLDTTTMETTTVTPDITTTSTQTTTPVITTTIKRTTTTPKPTTTTMSTTTTPEKTTTTPQITTITPQITKSTPEMTTNSESTTVMTTTMATTESVPVLECFVCDQEASNNECKTQFESCTGFEDPVCQTEVRYAGKKLHRISKTCTEKSHCDTKLLNQNCSPSENNPVCYYCCSESKCNENVTYLVFKGRKRRSSERTKRSKSKRIERSTIKRSTSETSMMSWNSTLPKCIDIEPPVFVNCPVTPRVVPEHTSNIFGEIPFPTAIDNSGLVPNITVIPEDFMFPYFVTQNTTVTLTATDETGNQALCIFEIIIHDVTPPDLKCPAEVVYLSVEVMEQTMTILYSKINSTVTFDLSDVAIVTFTPAEGEVIPVLQEVKVTLNISDLAGNMASCDFTVVFKPSGCPIWTLGDPANGSLSCQGQSTQTCTPQCNEHAQAVVTPQHSYTCSQDASWKPTAFVPDCVHQVYSECPTWTYNITWTLMPDSSQPTLGSTDCNYTQSLTQQLVTELAKFPGVVNHLNISILSYDGKITYHAVFNMKPAKSSANAVPQCISVDTNSLISSLKELNVTNECGDGENALLTGANLSYTNKTCRQGLILIKPTNDVCWPCPPGMYAWETVCEGCPVGSYRDDMTQTGCTKCPQGFTTITTYSKYQSDCKAFCFPGEYSTSKGLSPCSKCPRGQYQPLPQMTGCVPCPPGNNTVTIGSTSVKDCLAPCVRGHYSSTGLSPCISCPYHTYADIQSATVCTHCPAGTVTHDNGSTSTDHCKSIIQSAQCSTVQCDNNHVCVEDPVGGATCQCDVGYTGSQCDSMIEPTLQDACQGQDCNYGHCISNHSDWKCVCYHGFTGVSCGENINDCTDNMCENFGQCVDMVSSHTCNCTGTGYSGPNCSINTNGCTDNNCLHGGTCVDHGNGFYCICATGYNGQYCETLIERCKSDSPCQNGGLCIENETGEVTCECKRNYTGEYCETERLVCPDNPCRNNGTCQLQDHEPVCICLTGFSGYLCEIDLGGQCDLEPCNHSNTVQCIDRDTGYLCLCEPGWTGMSCNEQVDSCISDPCYNNGSCSNYGNYYICTCIEGYAGDTCQDDIDDCVSAPCNNGGTCIDGLRQFRCTCPAGFTGDMCSTEIDACQVTGVSRVTEVNRCAHGLCLDKLEGFVCICDPSWTGSLCDQRVDQCLSLPCRNNGTCSDNLETSLGFICTCQHGFTGVTCDTKVNYCDPDPCHNGGVCHDLDLTFNCTCQPGYYGDICNMSDAVCDESACLHNGTCVEAGFDLICKCTPLYTGLYCEKETSSNFELTFTDTGQPVTCEVMYRDMLSELSVCLWSRSLPGQVTSGVILQLIDENGQTMLSIQTDQLILSLLSDVDSHIVQLDITDHHWHQICVTWSGLTNGQWAVYVDRVVVNQSLTSYGEGRQLESFKLILGQPDRSAMFTGQVTGLNVYSHVISVDDLNLTSCIPSNHGDVISWPELDTCGHMMAAIVYPSSCPLSKCPAGIRGNNCDIIIDKDPPTIVFCPDDVVKVISEDELRTQVTWSEPVFSDNFGVANVKQTHQSGHIFTYGEFTVIYTAFDAEDNHVTCSFHVYVTPKQCRLQPSADNVDVSCDILENSGKYCHVSCKDPSVNAFVETPAQVYTCRQSGIWDPPRGKVFTFPQCAGFSAPSEFFQGRLKLTGPSVCNDSAKSEITSLLQEQLFVTGLCPTIDCDSAYMQVDCIISRKRAIEPVLFKVDFQVQTNGPSVKRQSNGTSTSVMMSEFEASIKDGIGEYITEEMSVSLEKICERGQVLTDDNKCVNCGKGYYFINTSRQCELCPLGYYSDTEKQTKCRSCDPKTTLAEGSTDQSQCFAKCDIGHYVFDDQCEECDIGMYQDIPGTMSCKPCPLGDTTMDMASTSIRQCYFPCGMVGKEQAVNGSCVPCPRGKYKSMASDRVCQICPYNYTTPEHVTGATSVHNCSLLRCGVGYRPSYNTSQCEPCPVGSYQDTIDMSDCIRCPSGQTTVTEGAVFPNNCTDGRVDECVQGSHECPTSTICIDTEDSYNCTCSLGFTMVEGECQDNCNEYCHHGDCTIDTEGRAICKCHTGYQGQQCQTETDSLSTGGIAGIGVGIILVLIVLTIVICICLRRRNFRKNGHSQPFFPIHRTDLRSSFRAFAIAMNPLFEMPGERSMSSVFGRTRSTRSRTKWSGVPTTVSEHTGARSNDSYF